MTSESIKKLIIAMKIAPDGCSNWCDVGELEIKVPELRNKLRGNGFAVFQKDRGLGKIYVIEKDKLETNSLQKVRTIGFVLAHDKKKRNSSGEKINKMFENERCVVCYSGYLIEIDHKDGTKEPKKHTSFEDYQPLCQHCNKVKREMCKICQLIGKRFDAKNMKFTVSFIEGNEKFSPSTLRCQGCFWNDPVKFKQQLYKNTKI